MDESVKRRERLIAMRSEAAQAEFSNAFETSSLPGGLSNPFSETTTRLPVAEESVSTPRFDFYTDPMSAFSGNKRSKAGNQTPPGPRNPESAPSPAYGFQTNNSLDQRMYQAPGPYHGHGPFRSPLGMASPMLSPQGTPPGVWNESGVAASYNFPPGVSRGAKLPSPGFGRAGSPSFSSGQGRGHWFSKCPSPGSEHVGSPSANPGRGRDRWFGNNMSPGSGRSGGRGFSFRDSFSAQDRPNKFYHKSMVEDPWKLLEPVVWTRQVKSLNTPDSQKSWLPKSISMKKARVSEASNQSNSQFSLAEYLAASFNDAIEDSGV